MKFINNIELIKDKTVKSAIMVDGEEALAILFTDDTCIFMDVKFYGDTYNLSLINNPPVYLKRDAGIITNDEYKLIKEKGAKEGAESLKQRELLELERLTKKYEGGYLNGRVL